MHAVISVQKALYGNRRESQQIGIANLFHFVIHSRHSIIFMVAYHLKVYVHCHYDVVVVG